MGLTNVFQANRPPQKCTAAQASCAGAIRHAQNVIKDIGPAAASSSAGLQGLANCAVDHSERDAQRLIRKHKLRLPIPKSIIPGKLGCSGFRIQDWCKFLLSRNAWHVLCGLVRPDPQREADIWETFWRKYEHWCPQHEVFEQFRAGNMNPRYTAAVLVHGDEGRTRKKSAIMICSFHSVLGRGLDPARRAQKASGVRKKYIKMKCNFKGHVLTNRFLIGVLPKRLYGQKEEHLDDLFDFCGMEAKYMMEHGIANSDGQKYWLAPLAVVGDWPFLCKAGGLTRSFNCTVKVIAKKKRNPPRGICHICKAGQDGFPFEDLCNLQPHWLSTMHNESPFSPKPNPFLSWPHPRGQPAALFQFDVWHGFHLGVGRAFLGSALAVASQYFAGGTVDERFAHLTTDYRSWCAANKETLHLTAITKEAISWAAKTDYPTGGWNKGAATTVLMKYIQSWAARTPTDDPLVRLAEEAAVLINDAFKQLYSEDCFLEPAVAQRIGRLGVGFLEKYGQLAQEAFNQKRCLFTLVPKHHLLHHVFLVDLLHAGQSKKAIPNPLIFSVQCSEDFIGRPSRISRRVNSRTVVDRTMDRFLIRAHKEWLQAGLIR